MISAASTTFRYVNRGYKHSAVLIPGWATDYRIFGALDLGFNYLLPVNFLPFDFIKALIRALRDLPAAKVSLFGYSLGGFLACEFAYKYPELVDKLILVGVRRNYAEGEIESVRVGLKKNKRAYLYKFYTRCFLTREEMRPYSPLFKDYIDNFDLDYLLETLDNLGSYVIKPELLAGIKRIEILHGAADRIAPIEEAFGLKKELPNAELTIIKEASHLPFLTSSLRGRTKHINSVVA